VRFERKIMQVEQNILKALEDSNASFAEFKRGIEARFADLETGDAKSNRPHLGGGPDPETKASIDAFGRYLKNGDKLELKSMSAGSGPDGGFAVPKAIDGMIESVLFKQSPIRKYAQIVQISTPDYHKLVNTRGWGASWNGELAAVTASATPQLVDIAPPMGELRANPQASQQMLDDAFFDAGTWIAQELGLAFGEAESSAFVNGNGVNQPQGLLTVPTSSLSDATRPFGTIQYIPTGAAGDFNATNPLDALQTMIYSMRPGYRADAVWLMAPSTLAKIATYKDTQGRFLVQPSLILGQPATLLGYAIVEAEHMPAVAANALPILFANLNRGYLIVDRIGTSILVDPFSNKPNVGYYARKRLGAALLNSECVKVLKIAAS